MTVSGRACDPSLEKTKTRCAVLLNSLCKYVPIARYATQDTARCAVYVVMNHDAGPLAACACGASFVASCQALFIRAGVV